MFAILLASTSGCRKQDPSQGVADLTVAEVKALPISRHSAPRVRLLGVMTAADSLFGYAFVQDRTGGVRLRTAGLVSTNLVGHLVEVTGNASKDGEDAIVNADIADKGQSPQPKPRLLSVDDLTRTNFDGSLVTISGVMGPTHLEPTGEGMVQLRRAGRTVTVKVVAYDHGQASLMIDSEVNVTGVASTFLDVDGHVTSFLLTAQQMDRLALRQAKPDLLQAAPWKVADILRLSVPPDHRIRVVGVPTGQDAFHWELRDGSSTIPLQLSSGFTVDKTSREIAAFVTAHDHHIGLEDGVILNGKEDPPGEHTDRPGTLPVVTHSAQIRSMTFAQAHLRRPVQLDGILTFLHPSYKIVFFQDATGGIFVSGQGVGNLPALRAGDRVHLSGFTAPGDFVPIIEKAQIKTISSGHLPAPLKMDLEDILAGRADSQWVELEGIVRRTVKANPAEATLAIGPHLLQLIFPDANGIPDSWVDARIRVRGVAGTLFNSKRQLLGTQLFVPGLDQCSVLEPSLGSSLFAGVPINIRELLQFDKDRTLGHRVHVRGVVLASSRLGPTWITDATSGVLIRTHDDIRVSAGDIVDVSGFAVPGVASPEITEATLRKSGSTSPVKPVPMLPIDALSGAVDARLVQISGLLLDQYNYSQHRVLLLRSGSSVFEAEAEPDFPVYEEGAILSVTGICSVRADIAKNALVPRGFRLHLRSPADVVVLRAAPLLSPQMLLLVVGITGGLMLIGTIWVSLLRRRVSLQKKVIAQQLAEVESLKQIELLKEAAEAASRTKSEFLANISHEIRTPMNGIIGLTDLSLHSEVPPHLRENLLIVKSSAELLLTVMNDILDFSKIEADKLEVDHLEFDLISNIEETIRSFSFRAQEKGLELICDIAADVPQVVIGDPTRLRQVMGNLLSNALKFTAVGEISLHVSAECVPSQPVQLHFVVRDTGLGIPAEKHHLIFEAFTQADTSTTRKYGGTGLGLTISARLVEAMGGKVWVESQPEKGSSFHFTVQVPVPAHPDAVTIPEVSRLAGVRILVVEPNATNRRALGSILDHWQMRPKLVSSVQSALQELDAAAEAGAPIPVMLCDWQMTGTEGAGRLQLLSSSLRGTSIVLLCPPGQNGDIFHCAQIGVSADVTKPVRRRDLSVALHAALSPSEQGSSPGAPDLAVEPAPQPRLRILVAEDNLVNQKVLRKILDRQQCEVQVVDNGLQALHQLATANYDAVFMDVQMPEMDGLEATRRIRDREGESGKHQIIIAMTAHAMKGDRDHCLAVGMDDYISKPMRPAELEALLNRIRHWDELSSKHLPEASKTSVL